MRRSARVVAVADALRAELVERFGLDPSRVVTIPNGVDAARLRATRPRAEVRAALEIATDARVVLSLGALTWEKDPLAHLRVVAEVVAKRPDVVHLIVGDGPLRPDLEREVRRLDAVGRTRVLGSREDVADLLAASDVLLLASRTEGMPASAIEAGMAGIPVIGYALSGLPEIVIDGKTGLLARAGDARTLVWLLRRAVEDDRYRKRLGAAASERCLQRFEIGPVAASYLSLYRQVGGPG